MVGAVSDTVGCLFSGYGWDPVLTVSPMLLGLFAGLLRPVLYRMEKPWDFWRVAVTLLPGKVLGQRPVAELLAHLPGLLQKGHRAPHGHTAA